VERILVIDDDIKLCALLTEYLAEEGMQVDTAHSGDAGLEKALQGGFDLLVLDVMLPVKNGFDVLSHLRRKSRVPVIMLTARVNDVDRIVGLEMGADDYLAKPFNPRELVARIRAVLRRTGQEPLDSSRSLPPKKMSVGDVELYPGTRVVLRAGETIELTSVEFNLLEALLKKAGQLVSRDELAQSGLGRPLAPYDRSLDVHVSKIRKKLGLEVTGAERIKTVRSAGYLYSLASEPEHTAEG